MLVVRERSAPDVLAARTQLAALAARANTVWTRHDYTGIRLALADDELERYLALRFPADLDFGPEGSRKETSVRRFEGWVRDKTAMAERLRARYVEIAQLGDSTGSIVAASRIGMIAESFSDALFAAEIPVAVRTGEFAQDKIDAYCDALTTAAETVEPQAIAAFASCVTRARALARSADLREISEAARPCLDALADLRPDDYPPLDEAFVAPADTRMRLGLGIADDVDDGDSYDRLNTRGVALRIKRDFAGAQAAYERALALDSARPEAAYNLGIVETFEATTVNDPSQRVALEGSAEHYRRAAAWFTQAAAHATGSLRAQANDRAADARKVLAQLEAFAATLQSEPDANPQQQ